MLFKTVQNEKLKEKSYDGVSHSNFNSISKQNNEQSENDLSFEEEADEDQYQMKSLNGLKRFGKRLETIDGVEIASSYREYMDLALSDLNDRLKKSKVKISDFRERIQKRTHLLERIRKEIQKRKEDELNYSQKDSFLRKRLIRNTQMKTAIQNLAKIAEYSLDQGENENLLPKFIENELGTLNNQENKPNNDLNQVFNVSLQNLQINNTYTKYIQMAYAEINENLINDKQSLIEIVRRKMNNDKKLKKLEVLDEKVDTSLVKLRELERSLNQLIQHDTNIQNVLNELKNQTGNTLDENSKQKFIKAVKSIKTIPSK